MILGNKKISMLRSNQMKEISKKPCSTLYTYEKIGKGGYGNVYRCNIENNTNDMAVKYIESDKYGIQCLMETSVMASIKHPNLQHACKIHADSENLYIISDYAESDLSQWTSINKKNRIPTWDLLRQWTHQLLQAVACLHRRNYVHCDIKAANVLIFSDLSLRLTDFTLVTKKFDDIKYNYNVCTCTHRSPECWLGQEWDYSLDIWSLGCTLMEVATGELLFPYQGDNNADKKIRDVNLKEKTLNCILSWGKNGLEGDQNYPKEITNMQYIPWRWPKIFSDDNYADFKSIVLPMLRLNPKRRPAAFDLLDHSYFKDTVNPITREFCGALTISNPKMVKTSITPLTPEKIAALTAKITRYTTIKSVIETTLQLFLRCHTGIMELYISEHNILMTCLWITSKILLRSPIKTDVKDEYIIALEKTICLYLKFILLQK